MADDLKKRGRADRSRVNVQEAWELKYWTKALGVSAAKLKAAVKRRISADSRGREELTLAERGGHPGVEPRGGPKGGGDGKAHSVLR